MGNRLEGRVAIVTGSGRGIGRGLAHQLAEEGASVVVNDFGGALDGTGTDVGPADEVVNEIRAAGGQAVAHYGDVSKFEDCTALVQTALDEFGKLDIMCHVAGILRDRMVFNMTEEEWDAVLAVHLKGAFNTVRNAVGPMLEQGHGRILLFSSGSGLGSSGQANYSAAKEGMVGFVRALSRELGPYGITANAIYPGGNTRMTQSVPTAAADLRAQAGDTFLGLRDATAPFEAEWLGHGGDGERSGLASDLGDHRRGARARASPHATSQEDHVRPIDQIVEVLAGLLSGLTAEFGVTADAQATGDLVTQPQLDRQVHVQEVLRIGVDRNVLNAGDALLIHTGNRVGSATTNPDDLDACYSYRVHRYRSSGADGRYRARGRLLCSPPFVSV